ncbi:hypothetical protein OB2597_09654 [Pseudooceanicola batsensis HTCC2597]|uniref:DUF4345 domain-containing protein n=1 Tax=Pseudooceanicola batsensis (strain ATCC BAA-863 / DSM 15984 / KCTC 12145 / HTCC2597) TaxID=252305 RepID=A3TV53_PSEBH|nr:DUF4345 domain-containing protein [Pseudooceanicola batsensis]EAQ04399.1 hypothetical protein OB2597_09654 [Pseudooceanicola batsensis HTCC2597]
METVLRVILGLTGLAMVVIGLNTGLGGMPTLGWQFPSDAVPTSASIDFARHDNNVRFFAATFAGMGLCMAAAALRFRIFAPIAAAFLLAIALGGVARLIQPGYAPLTDPALLPSVIAEIVAGPLLALWTVVVWRRRQ